MGGSVKVLAIIPARAGSKSVPHKNIRIIGGKPMLAHSIEHALQSIYINRVIVSTDSEEYAQIAREYGAEVPFIRPAEYATDTALDYDVFYHALTWLKEQEGYEPDIVVQLRPTYPIRDVNDIDNMIQILMNNPEADSVRSMAKAMEIPYKMWLCEGRDAEDDSNVRDNAKNVNKDKEEFLRGTIMQPLMTDIKECYNMPRQALPVAYYQNACIDVFRPRAVLEKQSMSGDVILGYEMVENFDIDTEEDFERAMQRLEDKELANN